MPTNCCNQLPACPCVCVRRWYVLRSTRRGRANLSLLPFTSRWVQWTQERERAWVGFTAPPSFHLLLPERILVYFKVFSWAAINNVLDPLGLLRLWHHRNKWNVLKDSRGSRIQLPWELSAIDRKLFLTCNGSEVKFYLLKKVIFISEDVNVLQHIFFYEIFVCKNGR